MDITEIHTTSDFELRKRIAELQGYEVQHKFSNGQDEWYRLYLNGVPYGEPKDNPGWALCEQGAWNFTPNYPESIEAAYRLEESVPVDKRAEYYFFLSAVLRLDGLHKMFDVAHSTARQKSEAWLAWYDKSKILS
jgi:hypothetical protein